MSFATETKNELARIEPGKKCCMLAEIAGFIRVSGSLRLVGNGKFKIIITMDNPAIARHYKKLIKDYFGINSELQIENGTPLKKGHIYVLAIGPENLSEQILRETGILLVREGNNYISDGIYEGIIKTKCCKKAYLRGIFMGSGTINDPEKGYHLEIVCNSMNLANDLKKIINTFVDLSVKIVERKKSYVVYMKNSNYISDTLTLMGAHTQLLNYENVRIKKEIMNNTVRITNCDSANTDRILDASERHIACIKKIDKTVGILKLPEKLRVVANLRIENPEASLSQLGEMMQPPLKKSGVNNRLKKIEDYSNKL